VSAVIKLTINGSAQRVETDSERSLLSVLRDDLDLTGAKYGCGEGRCGACTVLVEGQPVHSCVLRVGTAEGKRITTIEGLEKEGRLHPLQQAFLDAGALQCGYCTAGMILAGVGLLQKNADPGEADIRRSLEGNICRCGTYARIVAAVRQAADALKGGAR
jgi:nicotinate dehydrogenase subunit A